MLFTWLKTKKQSCMEKHLMLIVNKIQSVSFLAVMHNENLYHEPNM
jgi:hypothetical protein